MTKRLMQVFVAAGAMALLAGAAEAKTAASNAPASTWAQLAAATTTTPGACLNDPSELSSARAAAVAARFAAAEQSATAVQARAPDWGAYDAAYRGGPISTYGADAPVGVGLRLRF
jgi:hypothetical protein